jgi:hypothetical protein
VFSSIERVEWMSWLSVTSTLLCDPEVKKRSWRRERCIKNTSKKDGDGCMDGYDCWLGWPVFHECMGMDERAKVTRDKASIT